MALIILSSTLVPREHLTLLWNNDADVIAVAPDEDLDHIGHATVFHIRGLTYGFFDAGRDSEVEGCDLGASHQYIVLEK
jgi:hypothetical protein